MIEADLVSVGDNSETANKHGRRDDRVGGEKREMEGNGRIYMNDKWTHLAISPAVPATHNTSSRHFPFPFLSAVSTFTIVELNRDLPPPPLALLTLSFPCAVLLSRSQLALVI
jgi:hypothetical protein